MNLVIIKGRLTADVDMKMTPSGVAIAKFSLAVDRQYKNANGEKQTDFISCVAWKQTAETISKYVSKGQEILITGEIQQNNYESNGVKHYSYIVNVNKFEFCGNKSDSNNQFTEKLNNSQPISQNNQNDDNSSLNDLSGYEEILSDGEVPF